ncbi:MAG: ribonuclease P protein component [Actinomycetota bacterium]
MGSGSTLRSARDFHRVMAAGRVARRGVLTAVVVVREDEMGSRLGLAVRTRGGSVVRNRVRRRLREAFRRCDAEPGLDVVVRADERAGEVAFQELVEDLCGAVAIAAGVRG